MVNNLESTKRESSTFSRKISSYNTVGLPDTRSHSDARRRRTVRSMKSLLQKLVSLSGSETVFYIIVSRPFSPSAQTFSKQANTKIRAEQLKRGRKKTILR